MQTFRMFVVLSRVYGISSDLKVEEVICHNAEILKPFNGLTGIRRPGTKGTPMRTHEQYQHLPCPSFPGECSGLPRLDLFPKCWLLHTEILFNANQSFKFPVILASHSYVRCRISTPLLLVKRREKSEHCCVFLEWKPWLEQPLLCILRKLKKEKSTAADIALREEVPSQ